MRSSCLTGEARDNNLLPRQVRAFNHAFSINPGVLYNLLAVSKTLCLLRVLCFFPFEIEYTPLKNMVSILRSLISCLRHSDVLKSSSA